VAEMEASRRPGAGEMDAYERVLGDAMAGDPTLFAREDNVEEAWRIVDPVLKAGTPVYEYEPGTWGPKEADAVTPPGGWHNPMVPPGGRAEPPPLPLPSPQRGEGCAAPPPPEGERVAVRAETLASSGEARAGMVRGNKLRERKRSERAD